MATLNEIQNGALSALGGKSTGTTSTGLRSVKSVQNSALEALKTQSYVAPEPAPVQVAPKPTNIWQSIGNTFSTIKSGIQTAFNPAIVNTPANKFFAGSGGDFLSNAQLNMEELNYISVNLIDNGISKLQDMSFKQSLQDASNSYDSKSKVDELMKQATPQSVLDWVNPVRMEKYKLLISKEILTHPTDYLADIQKGTEGVLFGNQLTGHIAKSGANVYLGSSKKIEDMWNAKLPAPTNIGEQVQATVGDVVGTVTAYLAGGAVLRAVGFTAQALPILFVATGQTSKPNDTTVLQRLESMPKDYVAGWLFSSIPASDKFLSFQTYANAVTSGALAKGDAFVNYLIQGMSPKDALKASQWAEVTGALFYVGNTALERAVSPTVHQEKVTLPPDEVARNVQTSGKSDTVEGQNMLRLARIAKATGGELEAIAIELHPSPVYKIAQSNEFTSKALQVMGIDTPSVTLNNGEKITDGTIFQIRITPTKLLPTGEVPVASENAPTEKATTSDVVETPTSTEVQNKPSTEPKTGVSDAIGGVVNNVGQSVQSSANPVEPTVATNGTPAPVQETPATNSTPTVAPTQEVDTGYRGSHQIQDSVDIASIDLTKLKEEVKALDGYISNEKLKDFNKLQKLQSNPDAEVKIYRASPVNELNGGDWVTTNRDYANNIKNQNGGKVYEYTVKANELNLPKNIGDNPSGARFSAFQYNPNQSKVVVRPISKTLEPLSKMANESKTVAEFLDATKKATLDPKVVKSFIKRYNPSDEEGITKALTKFYEENKTKNKLDELAKKTKEKPVPEGKINKKTLEKVAKIVEKIGKTTEKQIKERKQSKAIQNKIRNQEVTNQYKQSTTRTIGRYEAISMLKEYFNDGELDVTFTDNILTDEGVKAFGKYTQGMVTFIERPLETTPSHEAGHAYLDLFTTPEEKHAILDQVKKSEGLTSDRNAEEKVVEDLFDYAKTQKTKSPFRKLFDKIIKFLRSLIGKEDKVKKLYDDIIAKKRTNESWLKKDQGEYFAKQEEQVRYTTKSLEIMAQDLESGQLKPVTDKANIERYMQRAGLSEVDKELFTNTLKGYDKKVNVAEFMTSMRNAIMPLTRVDTQTWATYNNSGNLVSLREKDHGQNQLIFDKQTSHVWNSPFVRKPANKELTTPMHFVETLTGVAPDTKYTVIPRTDPETGRKYFFVVKEGIVLTSENLLTTPIYQAESLEQAQDWIDEVKSSKSEGFGLVGHTMAKEINQSQTMSKLKHAEEDVNFHKRNLSDMEYVQRFTKYLSENIKEGSVLVDHINKYISEHKESVQGSSSALYEVAADILGNKLSKSAYYFYSDEGGKVLSKFLHDDLGISGIEAESDNISIFSRISDIRVNPDSKELDMGRFVGLVENDPFYNFAERQKSIDTYKNDLLSKYDELNRLKDIASREVENVPVVAITENQSDPMQSNKRYEDDYVIAKDWLGQAQSNLQKHREIKKADKAQPDWEEKLKKIKEERSQPEWLERDKKLVEAVESAKEGVAKAEKRITFTEKQFLTTGSKFWERFINEEIADIAKNHLKNGKAEVWFPTPFTQAIMESHIRPRDYVVDDSGIREYGVDRSYLNEKFIRNGFLLPEMKEVAKLVAQGVHPLIGADGTFFSAYSHQGNDISLLPTHGGRTPWENGFVKDGMDMKGLENATIGTYVKQSDTSYFKIERISGKDIKVQGDMDLSVPEKDLLKLLGEEQLSVVDKIQLGNEMFQVESIHGFNFQLHRLGLVDDLTQDTAPYEFDGDGNPSAGDTITYNGESYRVLSVDGSDMKVAPSNDSYEVNITDEVDNTVDNYLSDARHDFEHNWENGITSEDAQSEIDNGNYDTYTEYALSLVVDKESEEPVLFDDIEDALQSRIYESESDFFNLSDMYDFVGDSTDYYGDNVMVATDTSKVEDLMTPDSYEEKLQPDYKSDSSVGNLVDIANVDVRDTPLIATVTLTDEQFKEYTKEPAPKGWGVDKDGQFIWDYKVDLAGQPDYIAVADHAKNKILAYAKSIRPDLRIHTTEGGHQFWVSTVTEKDNKPLVAYQTQERLNSFYEQTKAELAKKPVKRGFESIKNSDILKGTMPVRTSGETKELGFLTRLKEQLLSENPAEYNYDELTGNYNVLNLEKNAERVAKFVTEHPQEAVAVSFGIKEAPANMTGAKIGITTALLAKEQGNTQLFAELAVATGLKLNRMGQEIVSIRGSFVDDSTESYIQQLLKTRIADMNKGLISMGSKSQRTKKSMENIQKKTVQLKSEVKQAMGKVGLAQDFINSLRC